MTSPGGQRSNKEWLDALAAPPDETAVEELRSYIRNGLAVALSKHGPVNDADLDDFTQDSIVRVLDKLDTFRGNSRFTTWAVAVAVRVALTARRRARWKPIPIEELDGRLNAIPSAALGQVGVPSDLAEHNSLLSVLAHAIESHLTDLQRTVVLAELEGMPSSVLAEQLGSNPNALYKVYHDARRKLRKALEEAGYNREDVRIQLEKASIKS